MNVLRKLRGLGRDQRGLSTVEYTVLLVLVVASAVGLWNSFGATLTKKIKTSSAEFDKKATFKSSK